MLWIFKSKKHRAEERKAEEEELALRNLVLEKSDALRKSKQAKQAIIYCKLCILDYEQWFDFNQKKWHFWQQVIIIGGVIATLSGVISLPDAWLVSHPYLGQLGWIRGVPAGIVTVAAGYMSYFTYREDAVRNELTANVLWNELVKFQSCAEPYNKSEKVDTSAFLNIICKLVESELHNWSALVSGTRPETSKKTKRS